MNTWEAPFGYAAAWAVATAQAKRGVFVIADEPTAVVHLLNQATRIANRDGHIHQVRRENGAWRIGLTNGYSITFGLRPPTDRPDLVVLDTREKDVETCES